MELTIHSPRYASSRQMLGEEYAASVNSNAPERAPLSGLQVALSYCSQQSALLRSQSLETHEIQYL